ncbi:MAG: FtsQ-type POTRA domain-containing protein [Thermodesulfobacteriota bacterium]
MTLNHTPRSIQNGRIPQVRDHVVEKRKRNHVILKSLLALGISIDAVLALMLVYLFFLHMPYFNLQEVEVTGNRRLSRAEIIEASEIEAGTNLLTINLAAVAERLKRHPWVRSAVVYRKFPGQLIVEIEERTPRAILAAEKLYYVDEQAEFFSRLLPGDSVEYPLFTGVTGADLDRRGPEIREMIRLGLGLFDTVERSKSGLDLSEISEVRMKLEEGLVLQTREGRILMLGKSDFEEKLQRYDRLKRFLTRRGQWNSARIINLDFEDRALVRSSDKSSHQG